MYLGLAMTETDKADITAKAKAVKSGTSQSFRQARMPTRHRVRPTLTRPSADHDPGTRNPPALRRTSLRIIASSKSPSPGLSIRATPPLRRLPRCGNIASARRITATSADIRRPLRSQATVVQPHERQRGCNRFTHHELQRIATFVLIFENI